MIEAQSFAHNTTSSDRIGFIWGPSGRSTSTLLQSCIITLLSCTWTVLHLNIPSPDDDRLILFKRKLKWTLVTLIAPEITCSVALRQWQESRSVVMEMRKRGIIWSMMHGFYATMGGYVLHHHGERVPLIPSEIISLLDDSDKNWPFRLPIVDERDIQDRSKTSGFAKFFALVQVGWLVAQCIGRGAQNLPVSQLEIATVAFAACTFLASGFWWYKPLDVGMTTAIFYDGDLPDSFSCRNKGLINREVLQRVKMTTRIIKRGSQKSMFFNLVLPFFCFSTIFSIIHLIAWNFDFATPTELRMWRSCSLTATLAPIVIAGSLQLASIWDPGVKSVKQEKIAAPEFAALVVLCYFMALAAYFVARMVLLFQVFYCLRSMPLEIYRNAAWINYIPHA